MPRGGTARQILAFLKCILMAAHGMYVRPNHRVYGIRKGKI